MKEFKAGDTVQRVEGSFRHTIEGGLYKVRKWDGILYLNSMDGEELSGSYDERKFILVSDCQANSAGIPIGQISLDEAVNKCKDIRKQVADLEQELKVYLQVMTSHGVKFI